MAKRAPWELWSRLKPVVRENRARATTAEDVLWQSLRRSRLSGYRFRRQHVIERFVVDFYCAKARLVIEVDGPIHLSQQAADAERQEILEHFNLRVLRFTNDQVLSDLEGVLQVVDAALSSSPPAAATPSPHCGEGDGGRGDSAQ